MADAKRLENSSPLVVDELGLLLGFCWSFPRNLVLEGELHRLVDSHRGEMDVVLSVKDNLLAVPPRLLVRHASKSHLTLDLAERLAMVGEYAKERSASGSGSAKNQELR